MMVLAHLYFIDRELGTSATCLEGGSKNRASSKPGSMANAQRWCCESGKLEVFKMKRQIHTVTGELMSKAEFVIFYSWQSDLQLTRSFILVALKKAAAAVEKARPNLVVKIDQATRDLPGAPNIPASILEKIKEAEMVVCDVTTVTPGARPSPNPNVVFELGYAVALLGWGRVALMFDESAGNFPDDMPFDFDRQRASPFASAGKAPGSQESELAKVLQIAIEFTIDKNPPRPTAALTPEQVKHGRDVAQLEWLMSNIHIPTIDKHIQGIPHALTDAALHVWEGVNGVVSGSYFHLHDAQLFNLVKKFHDEFGRTLAYSDMYHDTPSGKLHVFTGHDGFFSVDMETAWNAITLARDEMATAFRELLHQIRERYLEIDLEQTDRVAWADYRKHSS